VERYLNIRVAPLQRSILGLAPFPGGDPQKDGVALTTAGMAHVDQLAYSRRALTSLVGQYLGVRHIWGDLSGDCADTDGVDDTPNQEGPNSGRPTYPHITCDNGPDGDMFMNFADYTDDTVRVMFTNGQVQVMRRTLLGPRARLVGRPVPTVPSPPPQTQPPPATPVPPKGYVRVESQPPGAIVRVNGARRGVTPLDLRGLAFGEYTVEVELWGYAPETRSVVVSAGQPVHKLEFRLALPATPN
jgi:hypothetical protein